MNHDTYVSGFKLNYSTDTDNSSNSMKSNNSILTLIQQVDTKLSTNPNGELIEQSKQENSYFRRLKFSTSSFLRRINNSKFSEDKKISKGKEDKNNNSNNTNSSEITHFDEGNQITKTKPFDKLAVPFRRSKKQNFQESTKSGKKTISVEKDYEFLNGMSLSEKCRVSIECKNNIISIEGHKKRSRK